METIISKAGNAIWNSYFFQRNTVPESFSTNAGNSFLKNHSYQLTAVSKINVINSVWNYDFLSKHLLVNYSKFTVFIDFATIRGLNTHRRYVFAAKNTDCEKRQH
jgi:hypothetical protein